MIISVTSDMLIQRDIRVLLYISLVNHGNRIQNSYNLLRLVLAADSGWSPAANFILVYTRSTLSLS